MPRHVHADLMIAYANDDSLEIEHYSPSTGEWSFIHYPGFYPTIKYRIKPKLDYEYLHKMKTWNICQQKQEYLQIKVLYDGQTGEAKSVELMK